MTSAVLLLKSITIVSLALVLYSYLLYPLVLRCVSSVADKAKPRKPLMRPVGTDLQLPSVAVVFAAYNEESHVIERVQNLLQLQYPAERLRIYAGSDGSTDETNALLKSVSDNRVTALCFETNRGKASVLNDLLNRVTEDIVVFTDANTFFDLQAVRNLVAPFTDPAVGGVVGELRLGESDGSNQDSVYWRIEQSLKLLESNIGALLGANGGIYAIRREFWKPLPKDTICDDFCIAMQISASGGTLVYEPAAWAAEATPPDISDEYHRRLRIGIGNYQALFRYPRFITRTSWATRFAYISHKVLRWLVPHLLILALLASAALYVLGEWRVFFWLQVAAHAVSAGLFKLTSRGVRIPRLLKIPAFLFALNFAFLVASVRYVTGNYSGSWRRTARA